ncbi:GATA transcription factor 26-like [Magnolia sinica]|uniref:GATA transcription factor 26-like n=1 Tax=Magnolia sinica TaxID=86752 RepID=UPI002658CDB1|nr:GATA transcription factor 26-like [Magnolia sinica]
MGKQGPCCHCGVTNTPLWRNGPPGKPVLCNACGSRWRTKGSLSNYAPLHSRWPPPIDSDDYKNSREYKSPSKKKPKILHVINHAEHAMEVGETVSGHYQPTTCFEDDISNRSSSGSGMSFSESCIQHGRMDGNDISGSAQSHLWDSHIPSRKRTGNKRQSPSPVEKLRRDLCDILQEQESSYPSRSSEELLFEREEDPMASGETGLGGFLIKEPLPSAEEESEASSLMTRNKISCLNDANMGSPSFCAHSQSYEISSSPPCKYKLTQDIEEAEKMKEQLGKRDDLANINSESPLLSNLGVLQNIHSPQSPIDLQPLTDESFTWEKETSSSSSHIIEAGNPLSTNRPLTSHTGRHPRGQF